MECKCELILNEEFIYHGILASLKVLYNDKLTLSLSLFFSDRSYAIFFNLCSLASFLDFDYFF